jgi:hypothetical protein
VLAGTQRVRREECDVLLGQIEGRLATLRASGAEESAAELAAAEVTADALRRLVAETARSSAADRARVRAAVHFFAARGKPRSPSWRYPAPPPARRANNRPAGSIGNDVRVVNEIIRDLRKGEPAQVVG